MVTFTSPVTAILLSGGLDSVVLLADEASRGEVQPIYVGVGVAWEAAEREALTSILDGDFRMKAHPLVTLSVDMSDTYPPTHWARRGRPPGYHTPDADVYLPGRNIILLAKAGVYCAAAGISRLLIGTLEGNPFPDGTTAFRDGMSKTLSTGLGHVLRIEAPYAELRKSIIIKRGVALGVPFALTLSCMNPRTGLHCGVCSKCRERHEAFVEAGVEDPTAYDNTRHMDGSRT